MLSEHKWYSVTSWCCCESEVIFCHKLMLLCIRSDILSQADVAVSQKWYSVTSWCCCESEVLLFLCCRAVFQCMLATTLAVLRYRTSCTTHRSVLSIACATAEDIISWFLSFGFKTAHGIQKMSFFSVSFSIGGIDVIWVFRSAFFQTVVDASKISSMDPA